MIVLIYTAAATGVFIKKNYDFSQLSAASGHEKFLLQVRENVDSKISAAFNIVQQLKTAPRIIQYNSESVRDQYNVTKIHEELRMMANSFADYGLILGLQKAADDYIISSVKTTSAAKYYTDLKWSQDNRAAMEQFAKNTKQPVLVLHQSRDNERGGIFTLVKREAFAGGEDMYFYISFHEKSFLPAVSAAGEMFAMVDSEGIVTMSPVASSELYEAFMNILPGIGAAPPEIISETAGNYRLLRIGSKVLPGLQYVYMVPYVPFIQQLYSLMKESLLIFLFLIGMGMVLVVLVIASAYRPYSRIVKANEALLDIANRSRLSLKEKFMRDVLFGYLTSEQLREQRHVLELTDEKTPMTIVIFEPADYSEWPERYSGKGIREIISQLHLIIEEHFKSVHTMLLEFYDYRFALIVFGLDKEKASERVHQMKAFIQSGLGFDLAAAISNSVNSLSELHEAFRETYDLLEFREAGRRDAIMTVNSLTKLAEESYYYPLDVERQLIACVIHGKTEQAAALIEQVLHENLFKRKLSQDTVSQLLFALSATVNRILQQLKRKPGDMFEEGANIYAELLSCRSPGELQQKVKDIFQKMAMRQEEKRDSNAGSLLLDFIHENYMRDISLTDLADHFKISPGYAGKWFKEQTGENFKDYLNMYRVRMAKKVLDEKYVRIDELAKMVGCNNAVTFTRIFKRYEGISPSQYGRMNNPHGH